MEDRLEEYFVPSNAMTPTVITSGIHKGMFALEFMTGGNEYYRSIADEILRLSSLGLAYVTSEDLCKTFGWVGSEKIVLKLMEHLMDKGFLEHTRWQRTTFMKKGLCIWNKTNGRCWYCGSKMNVNTFTVDHFIPNKSNDPSNLVPCCMGCNQAKTNAPIEDYRCRLEIKVGGRAGLSRQRIEWLAAQGIEFPPVARHIFWFEQEGLTL